MNKIAIVKRNNLLWAGVMDVLCEKLHKDGISIVHAVDETIIDHLATLDLVIIDTNVNVELEMIVSKCLERNIKVAVWTAEVNHELLRELFQLGLHGYLFSEMEVGDITYAIKSILHGQKFIHPILSSILLNDYIRITGKKEMRPAGVLTQREWEVLELIVGGNNNNCIADQLFISHKTVNNHITSILRKLNVSNRTKAALLAVSERWIIPKVVE